MSNPWLDTKNSLLHDGNANVILALAQNIPERIDELVRKSLTLLELESKSIIVLLINNVIRSHDVFYIVNMFLSHLKIHWHTLALPKLLEDVTRICSTLHIPFRGILIDAWVGLSKAFAYVRTLYVSRYHSHSV